MISEFIKKSFIENKIILEKFITNNDNFEKIDKICSLISKKITNNKKIIICGNGGSMTDAMHFAEELTGRFRKDRRALACIALSDPSFITCCANDFGFDEIFKRGVEAFGNLEDIFIGLSTSGNSPNIIKAFETAQNKNLTTILLLGKNGGKLKNKADFQFIIEGETSDRIQEIHMIILHTIVEGIERILFKENY